MQSTLGCVNIPRMLYEVGKPLCRGLGRPCSKERAGQLVAVGIVAKNRGDGPWPLPNPQSPGLN